MRKLTIEEMTRLVVPFKFFFDKQYYLNRDEVCQIVTQKNMQVLTQDGDWEDVEPDVVIHPARHKIIIGDKDHMPLEEFYHTIVKLLHLNRMKPYKYIIIYHIELPKSTVLTSKGEVISEDLYYEKITKQYKEWHGTTVKKRSISAKFCATRITDKEGYIKQLGDKIKELEDEISEIEKS